jgi:DNA repair protein RadC
VYPRELAKSCLENNTAAVLLVHNHPSGECQPSHADVRITTRIKEALILLDVRVIDHLVAGNKEVYSFAEAGQLF